MRNFSTGVILSMVLSAASLAFAATADTTSAVTATHSPAVATAQVSTSVQPKEKAAKPAKQSLSKATVQKSSRPKK